MLDYTLDKPIVLSSSKISSACDSIQESSYYGTSTFYVFHSGSPYLQNVQFVIDVV